MALELFPAFQELMWAVANGTGTITLYDNNDAGVGSSQNITLVSNTGTTKKLEMTNEQIEFLVPEGTIVKYVNIQLDDNTQIFNITFDEDVETRTFDTEGYLRINTLELSFVEV